MPLKIFKILIIVLLMGSFKGNTPAFAAAKHSFNFQCIKAMEQKGYQFNDQFKLACADVVAHQGVKAIKLVAALRNPIPVAVFKSLVKIDNDHALRALKALVEKRYTMLDWTVETCAAVKNKETAIAIELIASLGGTLDQHKFSSLLQIKSKFALACIKIFTSRKYLLARPDGPDLIAGCGKIESERSLRAIFEYVETRAPVTDEIMAALIDVRFENGKAVNGITANAEELGSLNLEDLAERDPTSLDLFYYPEMIKDVRIESSPMLTKQMKQEIIKQIKFEKILFLERKNLLKKAGREKLYVWHYQSNGALGAFHAELTEENVRWLAAEGKGTQQCFPIRKKLNYVHNSLLKAYLNAKRENQIAEFLLKAFDISRYCIDARTELLVQYMLNSNGDLNQFQSLEDLLNKVIRDNMILCTNRYEVMSEDSLRKALGFYLGKSFRNRVLDDSFIRQGLKAARELCLIDA
jgi:hypothetical protein